MDENPDPPPEKPVETLHCSMCKRRVPLVQTRTMSGRILCFGCLASWYDDDDEDQK
jgi:hypothetical protein